MQIDAEQYFVIVDNEDGTCTVTAHFRNPSDPEEMIDQSAVLPSGLLDLITGPLGADMYGDPDTLHEKLRRFEEVAVFIPQEPEL